MVKAVIFDLDDTLVSERQYIESGYRHISQLLERELNLDITADDIFKMLINLLEESSINVFNRFFEEVGIVYTDATIMELVKAYRNHYPTIDFYDDVLPCLKSLEKKEIKTGIITDGYANAQRLKLDAVRASEYFNSIIVTDELGREYWKPHPKAFELTKDKLGVQFEEMVYVGDNPEKDFFISDIFPIKTVRIYREGVYRDRDYLKDIKEDYSIGHLDELETIIDKEAMAETMSEWGVK